MVSRRTLFATLFAAALAGCGAPPASASTGQLVQVQIVDRAGSSVLPEYAHRGNAYVAGRPGDRYAVRLSNRTGARVLVVLSVDGVNAVSGQTAATGQTGYVLAPWQSADITGWRKSDAEAAAFYFTALPDSYAARTDRPQNVGVIGVAVFRERPAVPLEVSPSSGRSDGTERRARAADNADGTPGATAAPGANRMSSGAAGGAAAESAAAPPATSAVPRAERLGTGHGEREYSPISRTSFDRATSQPAEIVQVRYDSHANLIAAGILPSPRPRYGVPEPFPSYVPDPR